jgi:hypothetical protein
MVSEVSAVQASRTGLGGNGYYGRVPTKCSIGR